MPTSITSVITEGQTKQYARFIEDTAASAGKLVLEKVPLDKDGLQRLLERGDEYRTAILEVAVAKARELSLTNQYANEEVRSAYAYPKEYQGPKPIEKQIKTLAVILDLNPTQALEYAKSLPQLPNGAEGWFAIPSLDAIAKKHFPDVTDPAEQYCRAVQLLHRRIAASRTFYNYRGNEITPDRLRLHIRTAQTLALIAESQKGDILVIAAQLGIRHRGRSVRRAREVFVVGEFGLGSLAAGSIILTHPERLVRWDQLHMDCSGDEFLPGALGRFPRAPIFNFFDVEVRFDACGVDRARGYYGSASGFVPQ
jgi:hypothetical protein